MYFKKHIYYVVSKSSRYKGKGPDQSSEAITMTSKFSLYLYLKF